MDDASRPAPLTFISAQENVAEFAACHRLAIALLPPHRLRALLKAAHGLPSQALTLGQNAPDDLGLTEKQVIRLREAAALTLLPRFAERAVTLGAWVVCFGDALYPTNLVPLTDAPPLLFGRGTLHTDDKFSVAVVGSRRATLYGREQATRFARAFAENGLTLVSGGAAGIDTAAHRGALQAEGRTLAILGCGVDVVYPSENRALFTQIIESGGALLSEFPLETTPEPWRFPTRNRIIAGIARASVLIETPDGSGALITARNAAEYGREVWAVPGAVDGGRSRGCHRLIQDGAGLADTPEDVLAALGINVATTASVASAATPKPKTKPAAPLASPILPLEEKTPAPAPPPLPALTPDEAALLSQFDLTPRHLEEAGSNAGLSPVQATVAATLLEMKSLVRRQPGNLFIRVL